MQGNPLSSWRDGASRKRILEFVDAAVTPGSPKFVPLEERIAVFDNDGTLWCELPLPAQGAFVVDRARVLAVKDPVLAARPAFGAALSGERAKLDALDEHQLLELVATTHSGMTTEVFDRLARDWLATARHPRFERPYPGCAYAPMIELLELVRRNGFLTFVVSGGGIDFVRAFSAETYGIPTDQVIGSSEKYRFEKRDGRPVLVKLGDLGAVDDREGKPVNIGLHVGKRPVLAVGNSDGDLAMLEYAAADPRSLMIYVHHDDAEREYAYDREGPRWGRLDRGLDEAAKNGWLLASMKADWAKIFA